MGLVAGIVVVAVQSLLIVGLLWQRARKRKAEAVLRESENHFRVMGIARLRSSGCAPKR